MTSKDLITIVVLILGLFLIASLFILITRGKLKREMWPLIFGAGAGLYMFVSSMTFSIFLRPVSEIVDYTISNVLWALAFGAMGYFGGRMIVRRVRKK